MENIRFKNTKRKQQERELSFVKNFIKSKKYSEFTIFPLDNDPPDFILKNDHLSIGLEVTELWHERNNRPIVSAYENVILLAKQEFEKHTSVKLTVSFSFSGRLDITNNLDIKIGKEIGLWIIENKQLYCSLPHHSKIVKQPIENIPELLEINFINCNNCKTKGWHYEPGLIYGGVLSQEQIVANIEKKRKKIKNWKQNHIYNEKWLLMVATGESSSSFCAFKYQEIDWTRLSGFDKVFILDNFCFEVHQCYSN